MKDIIFDDFQNKVNESLLRHRNLLDIITKLQESNARINRAVAKSSTSCRCINFSHSKPSSSEGDQQNPNSQFIVCTNCREIIEAEIGNSLFYLTSLCNTLDINLFDVLLKEYDKMNTLGKYTLR